MHKPLGHRFQSSKDDWQHSCLQTHASGQVSVVSVMGRDIEEEPRSNLRPSGKVFFILMMRLGFVVCTGEVTFTFCLVIRRLWMCLTRKGTEVRGSR